MEHSDELYIKIGFTREFAISILDSTAAEEDYEDDTDYAGMTNDELASELCLGGWIYDENMAGVFDVLPPTVRNAEVVGLQTGWPVE